MPYPKWHHSTIKKIKAITEKQLLFRTIIFSLFVFVSSYFYILNLSARNPLNKSVADTSIILIGLSMLLTSLCYFWNFVDTKIIYRKHLGLVGFAYGIFHIILSYSSVLSLLKPETWQKGIYWPLFTGVIATIIFMIMALISNQYSARMLGGIVWRAILRVGYIAVVLIWLHVFLLKSARIITWYIEGMKTPPSTGLITLIFMSIVIILRILLWVSLHQKKS